MGPTLFHCVVDSVYLRIVLHIKWWRTNHERESVIHIAPGDYAVKWNTDFQRQAQIKFRSFYFFLNKPFPVLEVKDTNVCKKRKALWTKQKQENSKIADYSQRRKGIKLKNGDVPHVGGLVVSSMYTWYKDKHLNIFRALRWVKLDLLLNFCLFG